MNKKNKIVEKNKVSNNDKFIRGEIKPVIVVGHVDAGKSTFCAALTYVLSKRKFKNDEIKNNFLSYDKIDNTPEEKARGITISVTTFLAQTDNCQFIFYDAPGHRSFVKNAIVAVSHVLNAVLVVSSSAGVQPQTREHLALCKQLGIKKIVVVITKLLAQKNQEENELILELIKSEVGELLEKIGYKDEKNIVYKYVDSLSIVKDNNEEQIQNMNNIVNTFENHFISPTNKDEEPFAMPIDSTFNIKGRGKVVSGKVISGIVKTNDELFLIGFTDKKIPIQVSSLQMFKKELDDGRTGDALAILITSRNVDFTSEFPRRGNWIVAKDSGIKVYNTIKIKIYVFTDEDFNNEKEKSDTKEKIGKRHGFGIGYKAQAFLSTADVTITIADLIFDENQINNNEEKDQIKIVKPGNHVIAKIKLSKKTVVRSNMSIILREGKKTIASGKVIELID